MYVLGTEISIFLPTAAAVSAATAPFPFLLFVLAWPALKLTDCNIPYSFLWPDSWLARVASSVLCIVLRASPWGKPPGGRWRWMRARNWDGHMGVFSFKWPVNAVSLTWPATQKVFKSKSKIQTKDTI